MKSLSPFVGLVVLLGIAAGPLFGQGTIPISGGRGPTTRPPSLAQYQTFAQKNLGNPDNGKVLFNTQTKLACSVCHSMELNPAEPKVGQTLFAIGDKFGRNDLIDSILRPSASIAVGYSTTTIRTKGGDLIQGIVRESSDRGVALMQADGKLVRIAAGEIERQETKDESLMPEGLHGAMTMAEFADLIEYLASLKLPESAAALGHGMPATIAELATPVRLVPFLKTQFEHPVWFGPVPGIPNTFGVEEHESGKIWMLTKVGETETKTEFLNTDTFQTGTRGLVGMVFHPGYRTNGRYFWFKHRVNGGKFTAHIYEGLADASRMKDSGKPPIEVLKIDMSSNVHYGGGLEFGPDGYLYVGIGDTGPQGDPNGNGQNMGILMGKMLRIDVDHRQEGKAYSIPQDNPFVGDARIRPEIWAYGLRTPWRFSFDPLNGDLWEGEVGQDLFEEVNILRKGVNYGWNVIEGFEPYSNKYKREGEKYVPPVFAYTRKYGASCTGGYVYRANKASGFYGVYVFGDYQSSRVFGLTHENGVLKEIRQIVLSPQHVVSISRDDDGELYVVGYEGTIYRMELGKAEFK